MRNNTAAGQFVFRELNGHEMAEILALDVSRLVQKVLGEEGVEFQGEALKERVKRAEFGSGHFEHGSAYPMAMARGVIRVEVFIPDETIVRVRGLLKIKNMPFEKLPPVRMVSFDITLPDKPVLNLEVFADRTVEYSRDIGISVENAIDRIREECGLTVMQPQKVGSRVMNVPVEVK